MGLIAARPEDPEEWAGIPSEPRDVEGGVDRLIDPPLSTPDAFGLLGAGSIESIVIPVAPPLELPREGDSALGDDEPPPPGAGAAEANTRGR